MSDTPETDHSFAMVRRNGLSPIIAYVYYDDMKKMELERDEAREVAEYWRGISQGEKPWVKLPWERGGDE